MTEPLWTDSDWSFPLIEKAYKEIEKIGVGELGLDIYHNQFEIISSEQMLDLYTSVAMPTYYNHWSFGKRHARDEQSYKSGASGLAYEIVANLNPCINYLMEDNTMTTQALVMAHAGIGHNFFFKNNYLFKTWTDAEAILDYLVFAKEYIAKVEEAEGRDVVETFLDSCHALMDYGVNRYKRPSKLSVEKEKEKQRVREDYLQSQVDDMYRILPSKKAESKKMEQFPKQPEENLLYFCEKYAPSLKPWERELIRIVRKISQYFYPQAQTKISNEGCLVAGSLVNTKNGLVPIETIVEQKLLCEVWDGKQTQIVYDWMINKPKRRIKIETNKGYSIHGGADHKILLNGDWVKLDSLRVGQTIPILPKSTTFPDNYQKLPKIKNNSHLSIKEIELETGISLTYYKSIISGRHSCNKKRLENFVRFEKLYKENCQGQSTAPSKSQYVSIPNELNEDFAYWLGLLLGDGSMSLGRKSSRSIQLVNMDAEAINSFANIGEKLFGLQPKIKDCKDSKKKRIFFYSVPLIKWLNENLNIKIGYAAPIKEVPLLVLKSPKSVVTSFIRGLFDADGCATKRGDVIYVSRSEKLTTTIQTLLLNYDIISTVKLQKDNCWRLSICGENVETYRKEIGFGITRKQNILIEVSKNKKWYKKRNTDLIITKIIEDFGITYDFSVSNTHAYQTGPFINHNCATYTHYTIMNRLHEKGLTTDGAHMEFLALHSNVLSQPTWDKPYYSGMNPYKLGFEIFRDIDRICTNPTEEDRVWFPDLIGENSWDIIKDAVVNYRDESFIRQFLSPKLIRDFRLFQVKDDRKEDAYVVEAIHDERGYQQIRSMLADQNEREIYVPRIEVVKADPDDRSLTLFYTPLRNRKLSDPTRMLEHVKRLWGYKVRLLDKSGTIKII